LGLVEESIEAKSILEITFGDSNSGAAIFEISAGSFSVLLLSDTTSEDLVSEAFSFFDDLTFSTDS
jgi:hypothetical protein